MTDGIYQGKYQGKEIFGFQVGHEYQFNLSNNGRVYVIQATTDLTEDDEVDITMTLASEISIRRHFDIN